MFERSSKKQPEIGSIVRAMYAREHYGICVIVASEKNSEGPGYRVTLISQKLEYRQFKFHYEKLEILISENICH